MKAFCIAASSEDYTKIFVNVVLIYNDGTRTIFTYTSKIEYKPGVKELQNFVCVYVHQIQTQHHQVKVESRLPTLTFTKGGHVPSIQLYNDNGHIITTFT